MNITNSHILCATDFRQKCRSILLGRKMDRHKLACPKTIFLRLVVRIIPSRSNSNPCGMDFYFGFGNTQSSSESHNGILHAPHLTIDFLPVIAINDSPCVNSKQIRQKFLRFFLVNLDVRLLGFITTLNLHRHIQTSVDAYRIRIAIVLIHIGITFCGKNLPHLGTDTSCIYISLF